MRTAFYVFFVLRNTSGPRVKFVDSYKYSPPTPSHTVVYATDRSKAVVPVFSLFCVALWFILWGAVCLKSSRALCPRVSSFLIEL